MKIGFHLTPFWSLTDRGATRIIDEAIAVVAAASRMGFAWVSIGQHWVSHPTVWPQPFPILARLAPETGAMRLKTSVLLLPIVSAVEAAENIATLDHICHGRLDVGVAIGYRETELEAVGLARKDRAPKLEESVALMKRLWSGEEITFEGRYTRLTRARMGFTCFQQPHPPLEMGAQSDGATRRAARITDGVFFGPRSRGATSRSWPPCSATSGRSRPALAPATWAPRAASSSARTGNPPAPPPSSTSRRRSRCTGAGRCRRREWSRCSSLRRSRWTTWTVYGSPRDCVGTLRRAAAMGLERVGLSIYSLPREVQARIDYLQMISEEIVRPVAAA
jgi:alkanesulfonate monooxygenase SsuD/methylene tetrahydromethanopterin reductase-like flavin-dependent oxidoreductase (luciferase family)